MNDKLITIFTPTYNRAHTLGRLYSSLLDQTDKRFCWLIVDDGSTDETNSLVHAWIDEGKIEIKYYAQENKGKPSAHNKGVEKTSTELFTCVDSDDSLRSDAVFEILQAWENIPGDCIGILAFRETSDMASITSFPDNNIVKGTLGDLYSHGLKGDTMLVFRSAVLKKFSFPCFEGEKFIPEAYLYDLLDQEGKLFLLKKPLYVCEYLPDGYTSNMASVLYNNPKGYFCYINQRLHFDNTILLRFTDSIRYDAMKIAHGEKQIVRDAVYPIYALLAFPAGWIFYKLRYSRFAEK